MSLWSRRPALRWLVPGALSVLMIGGGVAAGAIAVANEPNLPPRSAAELLVDLQTADLDGLSGTVVFSTDLGLPALPESRGHGSADLGSLWSGSHTLRVWYGGPEQVRVALLGTLDQCDIIRNGSDLWIWESSENRAAHYVLPDAEESAPASVPPLTPQQAADAALAGLDPTTEVSTDTTTRVAGRDAYELVLRPRPDSSLIEQVRLAIDAEHGIPLAVQVFADGDDPALEVRFTQVNFDRPDSEQFRFNPPPGTEVTPVEPLPALPLGAYGEVAWPATTVIGEGWEAVAVTRLPQLTDRPELAWLLAALPTVSGEWGSGKVVAGNLFSILLTDDGRVLIGAVTPQRLGEVAGDPAAVLEEE